MRNATTTIGTLLFGMLTLFSCDSSPVPRNTGRNDEVTRAQADRLLEEAINKYTAGDVAAASAIFERIAESELGAAPLRFSRAHLAYKLGEFRYAFEHAKSLVKFDSSNSNAYALILLSGVRLTDLSEEEREELRQTRDIIEKYFPELSATPEINHAIKQSAILVTAQ